MTEVVDWLIEKRKKKKKVTEKTKVDKCHQIRAADRQPIKSNIKPIRLRGGVRQHASVCVRRSQKHSLLDLVSPRPSHTSLLPCVTTVTQLEYAFT